jgi:hypothetical protein
MGLFGLGKQSRIIIIDNKGNMIDETVGGEEQISSIETSLGKLAQARIEVEKAMDEVRAASRANRTNPNHQWAAALVGLSTDLSEAYSNLRGAKTIEEKAYWQAQAQVNLKTWSDTYDEYHKGEVDYQGPVPCGDIGMEMSE